MDFRTQNINIGRVKSYMAALQSRLLFAFESLEERSFRRDEWSYAGGGGGLTCVIEEGHVFERGCVNFSHVTGLALPQAATDGRPELLGRKFQVIGTSSILHPQNPYVPTVHMNVRFFTATPEESESVWWFGGGLDLTPVYGFEEDAVHFHQICRAALDPFWARALSPI